MSFGITGILEPRFLERLPNFVQKGISTRSPAESWTDIRTEFQSSVETVIVLSHMGYDQDTEFLSFNKEIDILISGHSQMLLHNPEQVGNSWILAAGKNGEYVGIAQFIRDDPDSLQLKFNELIPLLADSFGVSSEINSLIEEYCLLQYEQIRAQAIAAGRRFYGTDRCRQCHTDQFQDWIKTPHANSLETLVKLNKEENITCLGCHTTGFGYPGGFISENETPHQAGIGCEECHRIHPERN